MREKIPSPYLKFLIESLGLRGLGVIVLSNMINQLSQISTFRQAVLILMAFVFVIVAYGIYASVAMSIWQYALVYVLMALVYVFMAKGIIDVEPSNWGL